MIDHGIFGNTAALDERYIPDYDKLAELVGHWKALGMKIVLTSGSFDLLHIGHALYLEKARSLGDLLIVGVDSDARIELRKKRHAVVPEEERIRMLVHLRYVDAVTLKTPDMPQWSLIKTVKPDILVRSNGSRGFTEEENRGRKEFCGEIVVLDPQATTSTSARIRIMHTEGATLLAQRIGAKMSTAIPMIIGDSILELEKGA
jgi:D-glycero-beta-D-manno-heptose 1-phosphate adenylyltransferase